MTYLALHILLALAWICFFGVFARACKKTSSETKDKSYSSRSRLGIVLQGVGFFFAWLLQHWPSQNLFTLSDSRWNFPIALAAMAILSLSIWLAASAARELGKQWSLVARLLEGHELITTGPYRFVRHPIYTALLGMLLGTLLIHSHWLGFFVATPVFIFGTWIRVQEEDRLLREQFGKAFASYRARTPALLPWIW